MLHRAGSRRQIVAVLALALATGVFAMWRHEPPRGRVVVTDTTTEILDNVRFVPNTPYLEPVSYKILDAVVETLQGNPGIAQVEVQSHTCGIGNDAANLELSEERAGAVTEYLVAHGVDPARLASQGYGDTQPIQRDAPDKNERIAFLILKRTGE